jgi:hypothetical protein
MQLHQTSHSRLLALKINSKQVELAAKLFQIYQKLQSEGIMLSSEKAFLYFQVSNKEIHIEHVGVEVLDIIKVEQPYELIDFHPEFCFTQSIKRSQQSFDLQFLNEYCQKMKKELINQEINPCSRGRVWFTWSSWNCESELEINLEIFSGIKNEY